ncbi:MULTISPECIES: metal ABC transporter solute-binding protein, Zn/Mn family [unclassified Staphylococcus]|uniref:metal ABC transporter solute-binding protein, Zn/Mn family n=1 Tax=unclassified Staphylococcus TaxID=91994 RepID=UPI001881D4A7|nr:zinc ABC transporter substrate-binding protein [Staphylococcus sp. GDY8P57P]MBF2758018.1 zinc ABC transporter substrate-binding protein [Staphylococcus haemolyticus]MBF2773970.1 zinc ABC transporter substrate-binding protein [Staphylococcus haemolyticus]MBF2776549.1 zinc ABC transporter substrate-binding protein [Staphylococcus haemolyticus]MBF2815867.1 zinc ABC transporter substrate-binding protein [Staphylococcus haemolyticus]MBF9719413.1 zinc ABC transporter substrate-binding protein [St
MKRIIYFFIVLCLCMTVTACSTEQYSSAKKKDISTDNKLNIYTTVFAFESFTKQIGGKYVNVDTIYPPGADTHTYEPTQRDMINIAKSDVFIYSSDDLDPVAKTITESMTNNDMKLAVASDLNHHTLLEEDHDHDEHEHQHNHEASSHDPHVWLDPVLDKHFAEKIKNDLVKRDPQHKAYYEHNFKKLNQDLTDLDQKLKVITEHPKRHKVIISHDSLGYLAERYHFQQEGVSGMNNEEPSQKDILALIKQINHTQQPYILYEQNITSKITDVIRDETNAEPLSFNNLSVLSKEQANDKDLTFQSIMKQNIKALDKALNH